MEFYLLIATLALISIGSVFNSIRQLQMLQQNSYFPSRYTGWLIKNLPLSQTICYFLASVLLYFNLYYVLVVFALIYAVVSIIIAIKTQKNSIKPLVFTGRIKRQLAFYILPFIAAVTLYSIFGNNLVGRISLLVTFILGFINPINTYLSWALALPIEKAFALYYINDAKRILKNHKNLIVIGITGSYGKTTTKFILNRILSEKYNTVCTPQSFNTPMGIVRTIREQLKPQTQVFICEMGAKNVGDIKEICNIVHPDFALITSVGAQHLETFKSVDNVFKTKFELADAVAKKQGKTFVNGDSAEILSRIDKSNFLVYGSSKDFDFTAKNITYGKTGSEFDLNLGDETIHLNSRLLGLHSIINISGAASLAYELGVNPKDIAFAVSSLNAYEHRLELKPYYNGSLLIDDAYNANPEGSIEAVRVLGSFDGMQKIIITPGLIELGKKEYECNYNLGLEASKFCDIIIFVGINRSKPMQEAVLSTDFDKEKMFVAESFMAAYEIFQKFADSNTVLLIENDLPDNYLN